MPTATINVLVVDDHVATRAGLKAILAGELDIVVVGEAGTAEAAVAMAARRRPDVVIMDLRLGTSMAGFDATREVLSADPSIGVLLFTAFGERQLLAHGLECGARGFVVKENKSPATMRFSLNYAVRRRRAGARVRCWCGPGVVPERAAGMSIADLIHARRAELRGRMAVAVAHDDNLLAGTTADEMGFLVALLRDLLDESHRQEAMPIVAAVRARWAREGYAPADAPT
ncbi:MAG TPA: response regulator transcription factor [Gaiellales bacterium]